MPSQEALRSIQDVLFDENIAFLSDLDGFHIADISYMTITDSRC